MLTELADLATILTAVVAVYAYGSYRWTLRQRTKSLEKLLDDKVLLGGEQLELSQMATKLMLTEDQVIEAAQRSRRLVSREGLSKQHVFTLRSKKTDH